MLEASQTVVFAVFSVFWQPAVKKVVEDKEDGTVVHALGQYYHVKISAPHNTCTALSQSRLLQMLTVSVCFRLFCL